MGGIFKDVRFYPIMNCGHFLALPSPLTFLKVNNDGQSIFLGGGGGTTEKKDKREQNNIVRVFVKTSPAEGRRCFHKNTAHARLGV